MKTIHKYSITPNAINDVQLPKGAKILSCGVKFFMNIVKMSPMPLHPCIWALVDPEEQRTEIRKVFCIGTGHTIDFSLEFWDFLGTAIDHENGFVWHFWIKRDTQEDASRE